MLLAVFSVYLDKIEKKDRYFCIFYILALYLWPKEQQFYLYGIIGVFLSKLTLV